MDLIFATVNLVLSIYIVTLIEKDFKDRKIKVSGFVWIMIFFAIYMIIFLAILTIYPDYEYILDEDY